MLDAVFEVAPPATWLRILASGTLLLLAFTLLSHTLVYKDGYEARWSGITAWQGMERTVRWGVAALLAGVAVFGWEMGWPPWLLTALCAGVLGAMALEGLAFARR